MDQGPLVKEQIEDGKRFLQRLTEEGFPITAAAWIKASERPRWYLYIATPLVTEDTDKRQVYRRINTVFDQMPQPFWMEMFQTMAIAPSSPVAQAVAGPYQRYAGRGPLRYNGELLGDLSVEEAYIYPASALEVASPNRA
jgi:hypothetical protein